MVELVLLIVGMKLVMLILREPLKKVIAVLCLDSTRSCRTYCAEAVLQTASVIPRPG